jgi:hypothetical protein
MHICEFLDQSKLALCIFELPRYKNPQLCRTSKTKVDLVHYAHLWSQDQNRNPLCISISFQHQNISPLCIFDPHDKNKPPFKSTFVSSLYRNKHVVYIFKFLWPNEPPICIFEPSKSKQITIVHICDSNIKSKTHYAYLNPKI